MTREKKHKHSLIADLESLGRLLGPDDEPSLTEDSKIIEAAVGDDESVTPVTTTGATKRIDAASITGSEEVPAQASSSGELQEEETPFSTLDMFNSAHNGDAQAPLPEAGETAAAHSSAKTNIAPVALSKPDNPGIAAETLLLEELSRELIALVEQRVSARTGEVLDDSLRDELIVAVMNHIEDWQGLD